MALSSRLFATLCLATLAGVLTPGDASAQSADWRDSVGVLRIGYLVTGNRNKQRSQLEPFRAAMEAKTGVRTLFRAADTLDDLIDMQINRRVQYAIHSASSYATTVVKCKCIETVAMPTDSFGARGVYAVLLVPTGSDITSPDDLRGKRLAISRPPATVARTVPLSQLRSSGFAEDGDLGTFVDVENPVEGWQKILRGEADAVIGWSSLHGDVTSGYSSGTLRHLIDVTRMARSGDIRVIWQSSLIPFGPHTIRSDAPTALKDLLRPFLTDLNRTNGAAFDGVSPRLSGGFVTIEEAAYEPLVKLARPREEN